MPGQRSAPALGARHTFTMLNQKQILHKRSAYIEISFPFAECYCKSHPTCSDQILLRRNQATLWYTEIQYVCFEFCSVLFVCRNVCPADDVTIFCRNMSLWGRHHRAGVRKAEIMSVNVYCALHIWVTLRLMDYLYASYAPSTVQTAFNISVHPVRYKLLQHEHTILSMCSTTLTIESYYFHGQP
jgi:hypothetical protein